MARRRADQAGPAGAPAPVTTRVEPHPTQELPVDENSPEPASPPTPARGAPPRRSRSWGRPNAPQFINNGAGFILGLLGYALFINFTRGGPAQARGWIAAKFLNRPYGQAPSGATIVAGKIAGGGSGGLGGVAPPSSGGVLGNVTPVPPPPSNGVLDTIGRGRVVTA